MCNREIYDIGTKILYLQCFVTTDMFLFSISIIPEDLESSRRDLAFGSVKTRFKAIFRVRPSVLLLNVTLRIWQKWQLIVDFCKNAWPNRNVKFVYVPKLFEELRL